MVVTPVVISSVLPIDWYQFSWRICCKYSQFGHKFVTFFNFLNCFTFAKPLRMSQQFDVCPCGYLIACVELFSGSNTDSHSISCVLGVTEHIARTSRALRIVSALATQTMYNMQSPGNTDNVQGHSMSNHWTNVAMLFPHLWLKK